MKSLNIGAVAGNAKLYGKKTTQMSCGCCGMVNFTESEWIKAANDEIRNFDLDEMNMINSIDEDLDKLYETKMD